MSKFKVGDRVIGLGTAVGMVVEIDDLVWPYILELENGTKGRYKEEELRLCADDRLPNDRPQWEYKTVSTQSHYEKTLNELGHEGWELVNIIQPPPGGLYATLILKRPHEAT